MTKSTVFSGEKEVEFFLQGKVFLLRLQLCQDQVSRVDDKGNVRWLDRGQKKILIRMCTEGLDFDPEGVIE